MTRRVGLAVTMKRGLAVAAVLISVFPSALAVEPKVVPIAIFMSQELDTYRRAVEGFTQVLQESGGRRGMAFQVEVFAGDGTDEGFAAALGEIASAPPALIFAIGARAGTILRKNVTEIPVVFTGLLDPVEKGLILSFDRPGTNLTGTVAEPVMRTWVSLIRSALPEARRIGLLYDPVHNRARVERAAQEAERAGIELVLEAVASRKDVPEAVRSLIDRIDALWLLPDPTVISVQSEEYIFVRCLWSRKGVIGFDASTVRAGSVVGLGPDYAELGRQAAEQGLRILDGAAPESISVERARKMELWINAKVARKLGIVIPSQMISRASQIFE